MSLARRKDDQLSPLSQQPPETKRGITPEEAEAIANYNGPITRYATGQTSDYLDPKYRWCEQKGRLIEIPPEGGKPPIRYIFGRGPSFQRKSTTTVRREKALELIREGYTRSEIAAILGVSYDVVKKYVQQGAKQGLVPKNASIRRKPRVEEAAELKLAGHARRDIAHIMGVTPKSVTEYLARAKRQGLL